MASCALASASSPQISACCPHSVILRLPVPAHSLVFPAYSTALVTIGEGADDRSVLKRLIRPKPMRALEIGGWRTRCQVKPAPIARAAQGLALARCFISDQSPSAVWVAVSL